MKHIVAGEINTQLCTIQVLFLLYHYFEAREAYNGIRVLIAGYVWMTGYGNFSYYYRTNDYSIGRFAQMMWRLNFLVIACCIVLRNSYMLYYICPMHTLFTVLVYSVLGIGNEVNGTRLGMGLKIVASVVVVTAVWDIDGVFNAIWRPFSFIMAYTDPRRVEARDALHGLFPCCILLPSTLLSVCPVACPLWQ
jgi:N-acetylneuraminate 9-O-acetyltransferase